MQDYSDANYQTQYVSEPIKSDEIYANALQEQRVANMISQTSPDNILADIEWRIRGFKKNSQTGAWDKIDPKAKEPNSILVSRYITYLSSILNDSTRFTNLSDMEINKMMKGVIEFVVDDLDSNADEYGLTDDYTERTRIGHILLNTAFIVLKRSQNGMESRRIWNAINMSETLNPMGQQQKKHFWEFWKK